MAASAGITVMLNEVVAMPGGHFLHREHPQRFVDELLRVLPKADAAADRRAAAS